MLERSLVSRILFPVPKPSYTAESFPEELIWVPKVCAAIPGSTATCGPRQQEELVPCLLLTYPSARFIIMFFHSNAEDLGRCRSFCCHLRDQFQVHVLVVEYPGYGICPGSPSGQTVMENAFAAFHFVQDSLQWPLDSVKVFGRSIGTGPAITLASLYKFAGVILVTPFLSVQKLFRDRVGPLAGLVEEWFANCDAMPKITSPTMIVHGQRDEMIQVYHGESLFEQLKSRKLFVSPPDMEHNTNLLCNLQILVLPMFQFFSLPDYVFTDIHVPAWAYGVKGPPPKRTSSEQSAPSPPAGKPRMADLRKAGEQPPNGGRQQHPSDLPPGATPKAAGQPRQRRGTKEVLQPGAEWTEVPWEEEFNDVELSPEAEAALQRMSGPWRLEASAPNEVINAMRRLEEFEEKLRTMGVNQPTNNQVASINAQPRRTTSVPPPAQHQASPVRGSRTKLRSPSAGLSHPRSPQGRFLLEEDSSQGCSGFAGHAARVADEDAARPPVLSDRPGGVTSMRAVAANVLSSPLLRPALLSMPNGPPLVGSRQGSLGLPHATEGNPILSMCCSAPWDLHIDEPRLHKGSLPRYAATEEVLLTEVGGQVLSMPDRGRQGRRGLSI